MLLKFLAGWEETAVKAPIRQVKIPPCAASVSWGKKRGASKGCQSFCGALLEHGFPFDLWICDLFVLGLRGCILWLHKLG